VGGVNQIPLPADWHQVAPGRSIPHLAAHYGVGRSTIIRFRTETGVEGAPPHSPNSMADRFSDLAERAREMTLKQLAAHYGCQRGTVTKYLQARGLTARPPVRVTFVPNAYATAPVDRHQRDMTVAGRAVDECLRRFGRVYRCDAQGKPSPAGTHWNRNGFVLSDDEVIERAERLGWDANAWKRVAA
jgi:transposase